MATTNFEDYLIEVLPYAPDCPREVALNAVRNAAIEFCTRTLFWQANLAPIAMVADTGSYALAGPANTTVVELIQGYKGERLLIPKPADELARLFRYSDWSTAKGDPAYMTRVLPDAVVFVPRPQTSDGEVKLRVALAPTRAATGADTLLFTHHLEDVARGALARIHAIANQPYSDATAALAQRGMFEGAILNTRVNVGRSLGRASGTVEFQRTC